MVAGFSARLLTVVATSGGPRSGWSSEERVCDPGAVPGCVAPRRCQGESLVQPEVEVVLLRVADRAVHLERSATRECRRLRRERLRHRDVSRAIAVVRRDRPGG